MDFDDQLFEIFNRLNSPQCPYQKLIRPLIIQVSTGGVLIAFTDRLLDIVQRHAEPQHLIRIDQNLKLLPSPTHGEDLRHAWDRQEPLPHDPVRQRAYLQRTCLAGLAPHADHHNLTHD